MQSRFGINRMLDIQIDRTRSFPVAKLSGALSGLDADQLGDALGEHPYGNGARLALDLSELRSIDSNGLAALIAVVTRSRLTNGRVVLVAPSPFVAGVLSVTRLDGWFDVCSDLAAAEKLLK
jgi:anti-sigma B factor antagonist